jgi:hypothetical protein
VCCCSMPHRGVQAAAAATRRPTRDVNARSMSCIYARWRRSCVCVRCLLFERGAVKAVKKLRQAKIRVPFVQSDTFHIFYSSLRETITRRILRRTPPTRCERARARERRYIELLSFQYELKDVRASSASQLEKQIPRKAFDKTRIVTNTMASNNNGNRATTTCLVATLALLAAFAPAVDAKAATWKSCGDGSIKIEDVKLMPDPVVAGSDAAFDVVGAVQVECS